MFGEEVWRSGGRGRGGWWDERVGTSEEADCGQRAGERRIRGGRTSDGAEEARRKRVWRLQCRSSFVSKSPRG